ncbi:MAG: GNAT family N-acetyltransferase [Clostridia bacterium]|nr:GNAT family N-acetyltransferase [Clostridia bacterium]
MQKEIVRNIIENEYSLINLLSKPIIKEDYVRYIDDRLKDMYDHNFTDLLSDFNEEIFKEILDYKNKLKEGHIKISSVKEIDNPMLKDFDYECLLTMGATSLKINPLKIKNITFKNLKENKEIADDILMLETKYYGKEYGVDFTARKIFRYFAKIQEDNGLNYFVCYFNNKIIGYCYTYYDKKVVALDGLLIDEPYRHKNVATNLISYIKNYYNCPIYLHADLQETAKDIYTKIGFEILYRKHDYYKVDK